MPTGAGPSPQRIALVTALAAWAAVVAWVGVVWWLGGEQFGGPHSSRYLVPLIRWFWPEAKLPDIWAIAGAIRKLAHVVEYAILALLSLRAAYLSGISLPLRMASLAISIASTVAMLDEARQARLASRVGSPYDVALDVTGAALAVGVILWIRRVRAARPAPHD